MRRLAKWLCIRLWQMLSQFQDFLLDDTADFARAPCISRVAHFKWMMGLCFLYTGLKLIWTIDIVVGAYSLTLECMIRINTSAFLNRDVTRSIVWYQVDAKILKTGRYSLFYSTVGGQDRFKGCSGNTVNLLLACPGNAHFYFPDNKQQIHVEVCRRRVCNNSI